MRVKSTALQEEEFHSGVHFNKIACVPLDVVHGIIEQLAASDNHDGSLEDAKTRRKTLGSCALVCHAWNPIASAFLFRDLSFAFRYHPPETLADYRRARRMVTVPRNPNRILPNETLDDLLAFFSQKPTSCKYTKHLQLQGYVSEEQVLRPRDNPSEYYSIRYWLPTTGTMPAETLVGLINTFPNLRTVHLLDIAVTYTGPLETVAHALDYVYIQHTGVSGIDDVFYKPADGVEVLACFGEVDRMRLKFRGCGGYDERAKDAPLVQLRPRALAFNDPCHDAHRLLAGLSARPAVYSSIREVSLLNACPNFLLGLVPFLRVLGPTLEVLRLTLHYTCRPKDTNLNFLTALRKMEFRFEVLDLAYPDCLVTTLEYAVKILRTSRITPQTNPRFDRVVLHLSLRSPYNRTQPPITEDELASKLAKNVLDAKLVSLFQSVVTFRLDVQYAFLDEDMSHKLARDAIGAMFPVLQQQGLLNLSYVPLTL